MLIRGEPVIVKIQGVSILPLRSCNWRVSQEVAVCKPREVVQTKISEAGTKRVAVSEGSRCR